MTSKKPEHHSIVIDSKMSAIAGVYKQLFSKLRDNAFDKDDIFAVHLALEEAFFNAVKHGNKMNSHKKIKIEYFVDAEKIEISVTDQGSGFKPDAIADPRLGENLFKPGGRGLLLMNSYMDVVNFSEQGNSVRMVRYKEKPSLIQKDGQIREISEDTTCR